MPGENIRSSSRHPSVSDAARHHGRPHPYHHPQGMNKRENVLLHDWGTLLHPSRIQASVTRMDRSGERSSRQDGATLGSKMIQRSRPLGPTQDAQSDTTRA